MMVSYAKLVHITTESESLAAVYNFGCKCKNNVSKYVGLTTVVVVTFLHLGLAQMHQLTLSLYY